MFVTRSLAECNRSNRTTQTVNFGSSWKRKGQSKLMYLLLYSKEIATALDFQIVVTKYLSSVATSPLPRKGNSKETGLGIILL